VAYDVLLLTSGAPDNLNLATGDALLLASNTGPVNATSTPTITGASSTASVTGATSTASVSGATSTASVSD